MKTITIKCPDCRQQHAVYWFVGPDGVKSLQYTCNKIERREVETKYGTVDAIRNTTGRRSVPERLTPKDLSGIPEEWSHQFAEKQKEKLQTKLL